MPFIQNSVSKLFQPELGQSQNKGSKKTKRKRNQKSQRTPSKSRSRNKNKKEKKSMCAWKESRKAKTRASDSCNSPSSIDLDDPHNYARDNQLFKSHQLLY